MSMILFVLHDTEKLEALLTAWGESGATGVTVLESTGIGRIHADQALREDLPLMPSIDDLFPSPERLSRTLFTVVREEAVVKKIVEATIRVVGDLDRPNTGLLVVLPTSAVYGLDKKKQSSGGD